MLDTLKYEEYGCDVIGDYKMVAFLMGLQDSFIKFLCYLYFWDSGDIVLHYHRQNGPQQTKLNVGRNDVK